MSSSARLVRSLFSTTARTGTRTSTSFRSAINSTSGTRPLLLQAPHGNLPDNSINSTFVRPFHSTISKMGVHNIESKAAFAEALKNDIVVLDCFATWCGPCKVVAPQVVKYSEEYPSVHFIKLDVDEVPDVAQELGIRAMPTFLIFKNGEKVAEVVGANPPVLRAAIEKAASEKK